MLVWILSSSWLCHNFCRKTLLLKHFFLWPGILMAEQRRWGEGGISRHCQRLWLTELQSAIYQLQLALSEERRKRGVTLTTRNSRGRLCPNKCEASLNAAALSHIKALVLEACFKKKKKEKKRKKREMTWFEENLYRSTNDVLWTPVWTYVHVRTSGVVLSYFLMYKVSLCIFISNTCSICPSPTMKLWADAVKPPMITQKPRLSLGH